MANYNPETGLVGEGVKFERIRRITGYLVGTVDRFNDGKACRRKPAHQTHSNKAS